MQIVDKGNLETLKFTLEDNEFIPDILEGR